MGRKISGNRNEDVPASVGVAPRCELANSRLQHLISMEARIFAQHRACERGDKRLRRMAEREMTSYQSCREIDLPLPVKGVEQAGADRLHVGRQIIKLFVVLARDSGRRYIEIASKVQGHRSV